MTTDEELIRLEADALPARTQVWVTHFVSSDGLWHHWAFTVADASPDHLRALTTTLWRAKSAPTLGRHSRTLAQPTGNWSEG